MDYAEFTLFEQFVQLTDSVWWFIDRHPGIGVAFSIATIVSNWFIFRYHYALMNEPQFLLANIHIAGRFSKPTYDMWKWASMSVLPLGMAIVLFSLVTSLRTPPFLAVFGIKGSGSIKRTIIKQTLQQDSWLRYTKRPVALLMKSQRPSKTPE